MRSRSSRRSASVSAEWRIATRSPKRARTRPTVCGASAISGTSTIAPRPALERRRAGLEVDLGLPAAGRAVEQERAAARRRAPRAIAGDRRALLGGQARAAPPRPASACRSAGGACSLRRFGAAARRARARAPASSRSSRRARARGRRAPAAARSTTPSIGARLDPVGASLLDARRRSRAAARRRTDRRRSRPSPTSRSTSYVKAGRPRAPSRAGRPTRSGHIRQLLLACSRRKRFRAASSTSVGAEAEEEADEQRASTPTQNA